MHYGDCLTWSKYANHILPHNIDRKLITGADKTYRTSLLQLLQTDLYNMKYFNLEIQLQSEIQQHISSHHPEELNDEQKASYFDQLFETNSKELHKFSFVTYTRRRLKLLSSHCLSFLISFIKDFQNTII